MNLSPSDPAPPARSLSLWAAARRLLISLSLRDVALAATLGGGLSGLVLHGAYDPQGAARTLAEWLLGHPGYTLVRNIHYWSAQILVCCLAVDLWRGLRLNVPTTAPRLARISIVVGVLLVALLIASGQLLRGDADARGFQPFFAALITELPYVGAFLAGQLAGAEVNLPAVLRFHVILASMLIAVAAAWSLRRPFPRVSTLAAVAIATAIGSLFLSPGLNDGLDHRSRGPWLFHGAQILLQGGPEPLLVVITGLAALWLWWALPRFSPRAARWIRHGLLALAGASAVVIVLGFCWPTEGAAPRAPRWPTERGDWRLGSVVPPAPGSPGAHRSSVPIVLGRPEGCLICHANLTGLGPSHRPEAIGCASCHGGDTTTLDAGRAHAAMIRIPGNLSDAPQTCGAAGCHSEIIPRVERSIMATFAGVIDVNRRIFGETVNPAAPPPHVRDLKDSAADTHLRQLCVSCHLGQSKDAWGPIGQESRGGGCNACHLTYSPAASRALEHYESTPLQNRKSVPTVHPSFTVNPENQHCFGCHSRSGRISTSYEGWHELRDSPSPADLAGDHSAAPRFRRLDDGRYFVRVTPDVHQARGLDCIDCHTASEVMGNGQVVRHKADSLQVRCEDCHARNLSAQSPAGLDSEAHKLLGLRQWSLGPDQKLGSTRAGAPLINVVVAADGSGQLRRKRTGDFRPLRAPSQACSAHSSHDRLSCASCHSAWAPRCASCHTRFDPAGESFDHLTHTEVKGDWIERSGAFEALPPTLGIHVDPRDPSHPRGQIDTFVPGMILELDRNRRSGAPPDPVFHRLYARMSAHTISRNTRSCQSCHNDPIALGYGQGNLRYEITGDSGHWRFTPAQALSPQDALPADAWIGFLQTRIGQVSTRDNVRPFNTEEQKRILNVGACLSCHPGESAVMQQALEAFAATVARRSKSCILPSWPE
jgi:hypothetical protein